MGGARYGLFPVILLACVLSAGCMVETSSGPPPPAPPSGTLTLDWTINGTKDPSQCTQGAATDVDITVESTSGAPMGEFQQSCAAFATTIDLPPGTYTASALLLDARGDDRTTAVPIDTFSIRSGEDLNVPIDFPANSFR